MLWKKKIEEPKLTDEDVKILERLEVMKEHVRQLQSDKNLGVITEMEYNRRMNPIVRELEAMERSVSKDSFDEQMGHPIEWLDDLFGDAFNEKVHEKISEVEDDRI